MACFSRVQCAQELNLSGEWKMENVTNVLHRQTVALFIFQKHNKLPPPESKAKVHTFTQSRD